MTEVANPLGPILPMKPYGYNIANHQGTIHAVVYKKVQSSPLRFADFLVEIPRGNLEAASLVNIDGRGSEV